MKQLIILYKTNEIQYPRVLNGYSIKRFSHLPHKNLPIINSYLEPLKNKEYELNQTTVPILLSNLGLNEFTKFNSIQKYLIKNFTYKLEPKNKKKIEKIINNIALFKKEKENENYYEYANYSINNIYGIKQLNNLINKINKDDKLKINSDKKLFNGVKFNEVQTIDEAISKYIEFKNKKMYLTISKKRGY